MSSIIWQGEYLLSFSDDRGAYAKCSLNFDDSMSINLTRLNVRRICNGTLMAKLMCLTRHRFDDVVRAQHTSG